MLFGAGAGDLWVPSEDGSELYHFDPNGRHLRTLDTLTGAVRFEFFYDSEGRLLSIKDLDGLETRIERRGNPTVIVAPFGQRTAFTVNGNGYLASVANPAGETHQLTYTADGLLTAFTDPRGNASQFTYDALGRLRRDANAAGGSQNLARTELADGYTVNRTTALNRATTYTVEDLPTGDRQRKVRAPDGTEALTLLGANGSAKITAPDSTISESLDGPDPRFGMQSPITTSSKVTTGGLTATASSAATVTPANPTDPLTFDTLTRTATLNGRTATSTYTAATRRTDARTPANRQGYSILDTKGRTIEAGITGIDPVRVSYDARGRLATISQGSGADARTLNYVYNPQGYLAGVTDPLGREVRFDYDLAGQVTTQTQPDGRQILYGYDAKGNLTSLTPPGQPAHLFRYTAVDQTEEYAPPDVGAGSNSTVYTYDPDKALISVARPDGQTVAVNHDSAGRVSSLVLQPGNRTLAGYAYTATGKLGGITAPDGGLSYAYSGALLTQTQWTGAVAGSVGYGYDNDFRITSVSLNGANPVTYSYDADSLLTQVGSLTLNRDARNGRLTGTVLGSLADSYSYNAFGELSAYEATQGATSLLKLVYVRDKLGRITRKEETRGGAMHTYDYGYDPADRLVEVKKDGVAQAIYGYDANGNRLSKTGPGGNETGSYDAQDRLLTYNGAGYTYTANGELKTKTRGGQATQYDYDVLGNLKKVTLPNGTVIDYLTDGRNRRIGKKVNGTLTQGFLWQGQLQPIAELDGSGNVVSRFVYATGVNVPDYLIKGGSTYRIIKDHLGSPYLVVDVATNSVVQEIAYDEFGKVLVDSNPGFQPFGFAGGLYDRDTGLVRFGARDYEAESGRWTAKDPIGFGGGETSLFTYKYSSKSYLVF